MLAYLPRARLTIPLALPDNPLNQHPYASHEQSSGGTEPQALEKSDEVEAVVAIARHSLCAGKDHLPGLDRAEEEPIENDQIVCVENQVQRGPVQKVSEPT